MGPLEGVRVIEIGIAIAGPLCARYLAHMGAEVIKVENRAGAISAAAPRWAPPGIGLAGADLLTSATLNGQKRSFGIDLKHPEARPIFEKLLAGADVFLSNMSVPGLESLRLTYEDVRAINPGIIYMSMPGFGAADGPYRDYRSWGPNLSSLSGIDHLTGDPDRDPVMTPVPLPDYVGAYHGAAAVLAAFIHRDVTGEGQEIELAQYETTINVIGQEVIDTQLTGTSPVRDGNRHPSMALRDIFPCAGHNQWVAIECRNRPSDNQGLTSDFDRFRWWIRDDSELQYEWSRPAHVLANYERAYDLIASWTRRYTNRDAAAQLQGLGIASAPIQNGWDQLSDPHIESRRYFVPVDHDRLGRDLMPRLPIRLSGTPLSYERAAPSFGHDTEAILAEHCGLDDATVARLIKRRVVEGEAPIPDDLLSLPIERLSKRWAWPTLHIVDDGQPTLDSEPGAARAEAGAPKPLAGCRILDLSDELSAYGTYLLALLGAEVVRIRGEHLPVLHRVAGHAFTDAGKSRLSIDTAEPNWFRQLADADVVYSSLVPGAMRSLGFSWPEVMALNPRLSVVSVAPFGESGPYRERHAGGLGLWALSGMLSHTGYPDRRPIAPGGALENNLIGANGAVAALACLRARNLTGRGQFAEVSGHEVLLLTASPMLGQIEDMAERKRSGVRGLGLAPYGYFRCKDRLVSLLALFPAHWKVLSAWIDERTGRNVAADERFWPSAAARYQFVDEIAEHINALTAHFGADEFCQEAQARGVPAMPVNSVADLLNDPHLAATGFWRDVEIEPGRSVKWPGPPFHVKGMTEPGHQPATMKR